MFYIFLLLRYICYLIYKSNSVDINYSDLLRNFIIRVSNWRKKYHLKMFCAVLLVTDIGGPEDGAVLFKINVVLSL